VASIQAKVYTTKMNVEMCACFNRTSLDEIFFMFFQFLPSLFLLEF
jgi:hypothetical protein